LKYEYRQKSAAIKNIDTEFDIIGNLERKMSVSINIGRQRQYNPAVAEGDFMS